MRENYLAFYETLVPKQFPKTRAIPKITQEYAEKILPVIDEEEKKVESHLLYNISATMGDALHADNIRETQLKVIHLIDDIFLYFLMPDPKMEDDDADLQFTLGQALQTSLIRILNTIEIHYARLMDFSMKVPFPYRKAAREQFCIKLATLEEKFQDARVSPQLFALIAEPYRSFIKKGITERLSYHKLCYLNILMQSLLQVSPEADQPDRAVLNLLISLNFNDINFARYYVTYQQQQVVHLSLTEMAAYTRNMETCNTIQNTYPGVTYKPKTPNWSYQFERAKAEELEKLEKKVVSNTLLEKWNDFKIQTSLTVDEIACHTILWMEAGLITNKNKTEVAEFIATFYKSVRSEQMSADSMRNALYAVKPATMAKLRITLDRLIKLSRKLEQ